MLPDRQPCHQLPEGPQYLDHRSDCGTAERLQLCSSRFRVHEEPAQQLERQLVVGVEEVRYPRSERVGDLHHFPRVEGWSDARGDRWTRRLEARVVSLELQVLIQDVVELPKVRVLPVASCALAFGYDRLYRPLRGRQVCDRHELGPTKVLLRRLRP